MQVVNAESAVTEDLSHQTGSNRFSRVNRNHRAAAILMAEKVMTPSNAGLFETGSQERSKQFGTCYPWQPAHAATVIR